LAEGGIAEHRENDKEGSKQVTHELDDLFSTKFEVVSKVLLVLSTDKEKVHVCTCMKVVGWPRSTAKPECPIFHLRDVTEGIPQGPKSLCENGDGRKGDFIPVDRAR
jgi:hypothetical protein